MQKKQNSMRKIAKKAVILIIRWQEAYPLLYVRYALIIFVETKTGTRHVAKL